LIKKEEKLNNNNKKKQKFIQLIIKHTMSSDDARHWMLD